MKTLRGRFKRARKLRSAVCLLALGVLLCVQPGLARAAPILDAEIGTLTSTVYATLSDTFAGTGLSAMITMPFAGSALVISSFSSEWSTTVSPKMAAWQIQGSGTDSQILERYLSASTDTGIVTATHVFTGLSSGSQTFQLYHQMTGGEGTIGTYNGSLVAIPLVTSTGIALGYGVDTLDSAGSTTTSSTLAAVSGLSTTVDLPAAGNIFIAASFNGKIDRIGDAVWDLVVDDVPVGTLTRRDFVLGEIDRAETVSLFALAEGLSSGSHTIELRAANTDGEAVVTTYNATLAAVALQLDENTYFPSFQANVSSATTGSTSFVNAVTTDVTLPSVEVPPVEYEVFIAGSYYSDSITTTGQYRLGFGSYDSELVEQYLAATGGYGAGGNVGLTGMLAAGTYEARLQFHGSSIGIYNPNLVGFALTAAPEPTTTVFALLAAGMGALVARRKRKNR